MQKLESVLAADKAVACPECGGFVFFDWGLKLLSLETMGKSPRYQDWASSGNIQICATCHHPVVWQGGDYYDAETFIPKASIETLIKEGQARHHQVPVRAMDP